MNTFEIAELADGSIIIEFTKNPTKNEHPLLINFINKKNGNNYITSIKTYTLPHKISDRHLELLFKEYNLPYYSKKYIDMLKEQRNKLSNKSHKEIISIINDRENLPIIKFGKFKGLLYSELPSSYLLWIVNKHFDKNIKEFAIKEIERREIVYIL